MKQTPPSWLPKGVTYRQMDYWLRSGFIRFELGEHAPGSGKARQLSNNDLLKLQRLALFVNAWPFKGAHGIPGELVQALWNADIRTSPFVWQSTIGRDVSIRITVR